MSTCENVPIERMATNNAYIQYENCFECYKIPVALGYGPDTEQVHKPEFENIKQQKKEVKPVAST